MRRHGLGNLEGGANDKRKNGLERGRRQSLPRLVFLAIEMGQVDSLTVTLFGSDSDAVSLDSFAKVVTATRNLLNELDRGEGLKWELTKASLNSPLLMTITSELPSPKGRRVLDDYIGFVRDIPRGASLNAITQVQTIRNVVSQNGVGRISFDATDRESVIVWPVTKKHPGPGKVVASALVEYACQIELIGTLEIASTEHNERAFYVKDRIKGTKVRCNAEEKEWVEALDAMKLSAIPRVSVYGKAFYRDDRPYRMKVESLKVLPTLQEHPGLYAVQGIDITGGMDSVEYVRSLRDGT